MSALATADVRAAHFNLKDPSAATCPDPPAAAAAATHGSVFAHAAGCAIPPLAELRRCLVDGPGAGAPVAPAAKLMRAIYYLRTLGTAEAVDALCEALRLKAVHSPLIRHEMGYVLGQMQQVRACGSLEAVLADTGDDVMVRHECAEALGAIGAPQSLPLLERLADPAQRAAGARARAGETAPAAPVAAAAAGGAAQSPDAVAVVEPPEELRQTCDIARDFCRWKSEGQVGAQPGVACACMLSPYSTYDPAPPSPETDGLTPAEVGARLLDTSRPLFERYQAMFALRNRGGEACVVQLGRALVEDETSALLRHEVAYVLGQMQHPAGIGPLAESLRRVNEHSMVRHESAEALGAIESDEVEEMDRCVALLREFADPAKERDPVVRESCEVALDAADYWHNFDDGAQEEEEEEE